MRYAVWNCGQLRKPRGESNSQQATAHESKSVATVWPVIGDVPHALAAVTGDASAISVAPPLGCAEVPPSDRANQASHSNATNGRRVRVRPASVSQSIARAHCVSDHRTRFLRRRAPRKRQRTMALPPLRGEIPEDIQHQMRGIGR